VRKKVIVGLSGGVDSSVAAAVLINMGYEVEGLFMRNWHDTTGLIQSECHWEDDLMFAEMVAKKLGIKFHFTDLSEEYRKRVVDYMFKEYGAGRTPNPDVLCNREIKFDSFAEEARKLGGDYVATGHYCRKDVINLDGKEVYRLLAGNDGNKDQSYFLCQLSQEQLSYALFPIGDIDKPKVREIAASLALPTAQRKDSQGICFVGKVHLPTFLQQQLEPRKGRIVEIERSAVSPIHAEGLEESLTAEQLTEYTSPHIFDLAKGGTAGTHNGANFFTVGQRKGLNVGGHKEPLFVIGTDNGKNIVYVGEGDDHPGLFRKGLFVRENEIHWIRSDMRMVPGETRKYSLRIRYRQPLQEALLYMKEDGLYIVFDKLQRGVAPGQFAAWYEGDEVIGSGVIS
jgi:tRNA-specific 2-thiouridylase